MARADALIFIHVVARLRVVLISHRLHGSGWPKMLAGLGTGRNQQHHYLSHRGKNSADWIHSREHLLYRSLRNQSACLAQAGNIVLMRSAIDVNEKGRPQAAFSIVEKPSC
jgi:hypothetical protein